MRVLIATALTLFLLSCKEISDKPDLVEREGIYYKINSNIPFTGKINGIISDVYTKGQMKNGKATGEWYFYHSNDHLDRVGSFINGRQEGDWYFYNREAKHIKTETYKNGELIKTQPYE